MQLITVAAAIAAVSALPLFAGGPQCAGGPCQKPQNEQVLVPGGAVATGDADAPGAPSDRGPSAERMLERMDGDGDGKIQLDTEVEEEERRERMRESDANADGALDSAELEQMATQMRERGADRRGENPFSAGGGPPPLNAADVMQAHDADGDSMLNAEELQAALDAIRERGRRGGRRGAEGEPGAPPPPPPPSPPGTEGVPAEPPPPPPPQ